MILPHAVEGSGRDEDHIARRDNSFDSAHVLAIDDLAPSGQDARAPLRYRDRGHQPPLRRECASELLRSRALKLLILPITASLNRAYVTTFPHHRHGVDSEVTKPDALFPSGRYIRLRWAMWVGNEGSLLSKAANAKMTLHPKGEME